MTRELTCGQQESQFMSLLPMASPLLSHSIYPQPLKILLEAKYSSASKDGVCSNLQRISWADYWEKGVKDWLQLKPNSTCGFKIHPIHLTWLDRPLSSSTTFLSKRANNQIMRIVWIWWDLWRINIENIVSYKSQTRCKKLTSFTISKSGCQTKMMMWWTTTQEKKKKEIEYFINITCVYLYSLNS